MCVCKGLEGEGEEKKARNERHKDQSLHADLASSKQTNKTTTQGSEDGQECFAFGMKW
jgi:hypothetical protein